MKLEDRRFFLRAAFTALGLRDFSEELDWDKLSTSDFAASWELHPIFWHGVKEGRLPPFRDEFAEILGREQMHLRANSVIMNAVIDEMLCKAKHAGIKVCLLKGASVSREYYPEFTLRPMCDIDILIKAGRKDEMRDVLNEMGAVLFDEHMAHERYILKERNNIVIEAHTHLINAGLLFQRIFFPEDYLDHIEWENMIKMAGGGYKLPASFEFDYINLHAFKEGYERLKWLIDIALINSAGNNDIKDSTNRFTRNVRNLANDIIEFLVETNYKRKLYGFLWKKAILAGANGCAGKKDKLLMASACSIADK